jgi:hypothetical protein
MKDRARDLVIVLLGLGAAAALMWGGSALPRPWLSALDQSAYWILLTSALLAAFAGIGPPAAARPGRWAWALAATLVLFSLPVAYLWASGRTTYPALGGFLPWSDASDYHFGALHLLNDGALDEFNMRRPLNAAFLAVRLGLLDGSLRGALAVQTWLTAAAAFLAAAAIARSHGLGSGLLTLGLLYEFARPYLGTTFSECLGLTFGCLGFAACWTAAGGVTSRAAALGGGALLMALGQSARAGAYAVLPAVALWALLAFRPRPAWRPAAWAGGGVCLGLLLNASLYWQFGDDKGMGNANLAEVLYGVAAGSRDWTLSRRELPECQVGSESDRARCVYARTLERLRAEPGAALRGYGAGLEWYGGHVFGFLEETSSSLWRRDARRDRRTAPLLLVLSGVGVLVALRRRDDPRLSLLLVMGVAVLVCAPFLSLGGSRIFAATLPYTVALPALGLATLGYYATRAAALAPGLPAAAAATRLSSTPALAALLLGTALALACVAAPAAAIALHGRPRFGPPRCPPGLRPVIFDAKRETVILHVLPDQPATATQVPRVAYADWRADPTFTDNTAYKVWRKVRPGDRVIRGYDHTPWRPLSERHFMMIVPSAVEMPAAPFLLACSERDWRTDSALLWRPREIRAMETSTGP